MADPKENKETTSQNNKVDYKLIQLSIPEIISALHQKAIATCPSNLRIANSAIEGDGKTAKLNSAGQHIISVLAVKEGDKVKKSEALEPLQKYVSVFVGPDLAKKVTDKVLMKLGSDESEKNENQDQNQQDQEQQDQQNQEENNSSEEKTTDEISKDNSQEETQEESIEIKSFQQFLVENCGMKFLFEENDEQQEENDTTSNNASTDQTKEKKDKKDEEALGWYIAYNLKVQGLKETNLKDAMKDFATSFFDNLKLTASGLFGGSQTITGKDIRKGFHDLLHVDHTKLASNVAEYLRRKFPNIEDTSVEARDSKTLYREIKDYINKDEKTAVNSAAYCLRIKVREEDRKKPFLNKKKIAEVIRKCMAGFRLGKKAAVTEDSIIKIENFKDKHDEKEEGRNAKRPNSIQIKTILSNNEIKKKYGNDILKLKPDAKIENSDAIKIYDNIKNKFRGAFSPDALKEKENKEAKKIVDELEANIKAANDGPVEAIVFIDFFEEYQDFEKSIGESKTTFDFIKQNDVVKSILEMLFEDFSQNDLEPSQVLDEEDKKDTNSKKTNYSSLRSSIKNIAKEWITIAKYKTTVTSKDDIKSKLEDFYDDISQIESSKYNSFAVIDFHPNSNLVEESTESKIMNILFEEKTSKQKQLLNLVQKVFDIFKKENDIDDVGDLITIKQEIDVQEAIKCKFTNLIFESNDENLVEIKKKLRSSFRDLGSTKMKNPSLFHDYPVEVGDSKEIVTYLQKIGIGSSSDFDIINSKKLAALLVVKMPKETEQKKYGGSHGSAAFTDESVKKIFEKNIGSDAKIEMHNIEGTSSTIKYNKSKEPADLKVFIAIFDEIENVDIDPKPDDKDPKPDDKDPKPSDDKKEKTVKVFLLPFNAKSSDIPKPPDDDDPPKKEEDDDDGKKSEGTDLYVFPISSSKDFETTPEIENN